MCKLTWALHNVICACEIICFPRVIVSFKNKTIINLNSKIHQRSETHLLLDFNGSQNTRSSSMQVVFVLYEAISTLLDGYRACHRLVSNGTSPLNCFPSVLSLQSECKPVTRHKLPFSSLSTTLDDLERYFCLIRPFHVYCAVYQRPVLKYIYTNLKESLV